MLIPTTKIGGVGQDSVPCRDRPACLSAIRTTGEDHLILAISPLPAQLRPRSSFPRVERRLGGEVSPCPTLLMPAMAHVGCCAALRVRLTQPVGTDPRVCPSFTVHAK